MERDSDSPPAALDPLVRDFVPNHEQYGPSNGGSVASTKDPRKPHLALLPPQSASDGQFMASTDYVHSAPPLYPSTTWSVTTGPAARSAGLPPKPTWGSLGSTNSKSDASFATSSHSQGSSSGLGLLSPQKADVRRNKDHRLDFKAPAPAIRYTQTEEYHNSDKPSKGKKLFVKTDPLPQHPFTRSSQRHIPATSGQSGVNALAQLQSGSSGQIVSTELSPGSNTDTNSFTTPVQSSFDSNEQVGAENSDDEDVWTERTHSHCLRYALKDATADWEEAFTGSLAVLACVNPDQFKMPPNSPVINIKTEYLDNLITSVRLSKYAVMDRISERIMAIWNARGENQKVLLLFSVNGSKKFSGLAEMTGPWKPSAFIEGWVENSESNASVGSFPVTWVYVKDIPYHRFAHIRQSGTETPVGNMWNGMVFPPETGRLVVEQYVKQPATTSILGYPKNYPENMQRKEHHSFGSRRGGSSSNRGSRQSGRNSFRGAKTPWRPTYKEESPRKTFVEAEHDDVAPTPAKRGYLNDSSGSPTRCDRPNDKGDMLQSGEPTSAFFDSSRKPGKEATSPGTATDGLSISFPSSENDQWASSRALQQRAPLQIDTSSHASGLERDIMTAPAVISMAAPQSEGLHERNSSLHSKLQHSVSMGVLRPAVDIVPVARPALLQSGSTSSLPQHRSPSLVQSFSSTAKTLNELQLSQQHERLMFLPQSQTGLMTSQSLRHSPQRESSSHMRGYHDIQRQGPALDSRSHQLMGYFHELQAEGYRLQHKLQSVGPSDDDRRLLNAKLATNSMAIETTLMELSLIASRSAQIPAPGGAAAFSQVGPAPLPAEDVFGISPSRTVTRNPVYSPSRIGSPFSLAGTANSSHFTGIPTDLNYAQPRYVHGTRSSMDLRSQGLVYAAAPQNASVMSAAPRAFHSQSFESMIGHPSPTAPNLNFSFHPPPVIHDRRHEHNGGAPVDN